LITILLRQINLTAQTRLSQLITIRLLRLLRRPRLRLKNLERLSFLARQWKVILLRLKVEKERVKLPLGLRLG
jgi:hypothetical protein